MRYLLGITHPRRLDFFLNSLSKIDYIDILLAKNMESGKAYSSIKEYFLKNDYDYLILTSDDVEIPYNAPKKIINDIEKYGYDIITGWSRCRPNKNDANITLYPIQNIESKLDKTIWYHEYNFLKINDIERFIKNNEKIIPVWFVGFSLTAMSRRVVEEWNPKGWCFQISSLFQPAENKGMKGFYICHDLWFSYETWKKGFLKYADLEVYIPHYPIGYSHKWDSLLVGKEKPELKFISSIKSLT